MNRHHIISKVILFMAAMTAFAEAQTEVPKLFRAQKDGKVGFIDRTGKVVIPLKYMNMKPSLRFSEGLAAVATANEGWTYIDETGKTAIKLGFRYADAGDFSEGLACVRAPGGFGYIDKKGQEVIKPQYVQAFDFSEGYASVSKENQRPVFLDTSGKLAFPEYVPTMQSFSEGLAFVSLASDHRMVPTGGYIDLTGKLVVPCEYIFSANPCTEGVVFVTKNGECMGLNTNGEVVIKTGFQQLRPFSDGLAQATVRGVWGYIDHNGKTVIDAKYQSCARFCEGMAGVKVNGKWGFIDKTGKEVIEPRFVLPASWEKNKFRIPQFHGGLAEMPEGTKAGYIDKTGAWVWPPSE
ncbi:MAG: WG repeat-containing protein [Verrucomicrobiota bacterium]|jgi:hypothetical protein